MQAGAQFNLVGKFAELFRQRILRNWQNHGWNEEPAFIFERLSADLTPIDIGYQRLVVTARMLFVFSQAYRMWGDVQYAARARDLCARLDTHFRDRTFDGYVKTLDMDGRPLDTQKDFYGHAFVLFALASYGGVFKDAPAIQRAHEVNDLIKAKLRSPSGWFATDKTADWQNTNAARDQNPHMHLLEAYIALFRETQDATFLSDACALADFAAENLFHQDRNIIPETVDADGVAYSAGACVLEPGHQFEWFWILHQLADISGDDEYRELATPLFDWAVKYGVDPDFGGIYNKVEFDGTIIDETKRIWPVTECIKACAVRARQTGNKDDRAAFSNWLQFLLDAYLKPDGTWYEFVDRRLSPTTDYMPATTPYHLLMALTEAQKG